MCRILSKVSLKLFKHFFIKFPLCFLSFLHNYTNIFQRNSQNLIKMSEKLLQKMNLKNFLNIFFQLLSNFVEFHLKIIQNLFKFSETSLGFAFLQNFLKYRSCPINFDPECVARHSVIWRTYMVYIQNFSGCLKTYSKILQNFLNLFTKFTSHFFDISLVLRNMD